MRHPHANGLRAAIAILSLSVGSFMTALAQAPAPAPPRDDPPAQEIRVTLLGTGTPRPFMDRFGPSILVEAGSEKLIFDAGRGAMQRLFQLGVSYADITAVLITHLHSDHTVGLPDLWLTGWLISNGGKPLQLWGPSGTTHMARGLESAYEFDRDIRVRDDKAPAEGGRIDAHDLEDQVVFDRGGVKVTSFLVDHGVIRPALGYRVDYGGRSVALSGDTRYSPNLVRHAKGVDLLIHEIAAATDAELAKREHTRTIIAHHTTPDRAAAVFEETKPKLAVFSHFVLIGVSADEALRMTREHYSGPLQLGADLMRFHVGDQVTVETMPADVHTSTRP
jgi:ribonuclease Z